MSVKSMSKDKDEMRAEYRRGDLGKGVRGKFFERYSKGTNLVLLDDRVAKAFPTAEAVNEALLGLIALATSTTRRPARPSRRTKASA
jgi:hypothetical protein